VRCIRVVVHGRVQGVWFRGWLADQARARGVGGWVRNRRDGTVEAVFDGPSDEVQALVAACWQGPPAARVTRVEEFAHDEPGPTPFEQRPSV